MQRMRGKGIGGREDRKPAGRGSGQMSEGGRGAVVPPATPGRWRVASKGAVVRCMRVHRREHAQDVVIGVKL